MNGLELDVREGGLDQHRRRSGVVMQKPLQRRHRRLDLLPWRRHIASVAGAGAAEPVLRAPELAWGLVGAAARLQQPLVNLSQQAIAERQAAGLDRIDPVVQRGDVVDGFFDVLDRRSGRHLVLEEEQVGERGHRSLDLRGEDGLLANEGIEKLGGVRQQEGDAVKAAKRLIRPVEQAMMRCRHCDGHGAHFTMRL